ncbi:MAG: hypothetical protein JNG88_07165 [Phycisphaerales bacterium]|nr:hypothetical protein [Phycisphaerales bacterium]
MRSRNLIALFAITGSLTAAADTFRIEIDYMGPDADGHDHQPSQLVLDAVIQMFACQGHTLIIDLDDQIPHTDLLTGDPNDDCGNFWNYTGASNTYRNIRNQYRDRGAGWHYCIFAHQYRIDNDDFNNGSGCATTSSSGRANGGDALIVTLGGFSGQTGTEFEQAATLAHEFGHNLGLSHVGSMDESVVSPYIQILPSVMSYSYQLRGVREGLIANGLAPEYALFKNIDYSFGRMCPQNEASLNELSGTRMQRVDFNCDDDTSDTGVLQDLGFRGSGMGSNAPWCGEADESRTTLNDYNEWSNISDGAGLVDRGETGDPAALQELALRELKMPICITYEDHIAFWPPNGLGGGPELAVEACITGQNVYVGPLNIIEAGFCVFPFDSVQQAQSSSPSRSVYYITPGTYNESGTTVLNQRGIWTCNTGTARIQ